jgi:hypothetical protein
LTFAFREAQGQESGNELHGALATPEQIELPVWCSHFLITLTSFLEVMREASFIHLLESASDEAPDPFNGTDTAEKGKSPRATRRPLR